MRLPLLRDDRAPGFVPRARRCFVFAAALLCVASCGRGDARDEVARIASSVDAPLRALRGLDEQVVPAQPGREVEGQAARSVEGCHAAKPHVARLLIDDSGYRSPEARRAAMTLRAGANAFLGRMASCRADGDGCLDACLIGWAAVSRGVADTADAARALGVTIPPIHP